MVREEGSKPDLAAEAWQDHVSVAEAALRLPILGPPSLAPLFR
jgi:hypothetical protein